MVVYHVFTHTHTHTHSQVSELIHKTSDFPDLQHCSVSVHFQDIIDTGEQTFDVVRVFVCVI
jgi:hypothetical protein